MPRLGPTPKWGLDKLAVGGHVDIPWLENADGSRRLSQKVLHVMVWRAQRRTGFKFIREPRVYALRVIRRA